MNTRLHEQRIFKKLCESLPKSFKSLHIILVSKFLVGKRKLDFKIASMDSHVIGHVVF